ncbi:hypothetical protein Ddye_008947 [Dipteronia dyeriana]|uniref:RRM domain-containing protein n=1 Tax=Dipteronia dyeriana TaxID=168575 RepID=A0AAD9XAR1_9ROSI|nr:hypothetical protein Ddye_008947 [Dipteronia dyeriana]
MMKLNHKTKKSKLPNTATKPSKKILKKEPEPDIVRPALSSDGSCDSESDYETEDLVSLLQPYTKDQLIAFISSAAAQHSALYNRVLQMADCDVSHRKVFVHGLGWDTTRDAVVSAFSSPAGGGDDIEDCKVVTDKVTGKSKGYAFVLFRTRKAAAKALRTPQRRINNRIVSCQLASVGPTAAAASKEQGGLPGDRKIYVSNVQRDVDKERLRSFFDQFGEIETGPIGFDINTGKSRGFAIFVYRTLEGAKRALEQPHKLFQGHQLHCQKATDSKNRTNNNNNVDNSNVPAGHVQGQNQMLAAVAAAQNLALFGQQHQHPQAVMNPVMNPAVYEGLLAAANPGLMNPVVAGALNHTGHVGARGGLGGANSSMLGAYGSGQGLPTGYVSAPVRNQGTPGSYPGYTSYMCFFDISSS